MSTMPKPEKKIKEGFVGQRMIVLPPNVKLRALQNDLTRHLHATAIGFYPRAAFHNRERKTGCNEHILLYCTAGMGEVSVKGNTYALNPNNFIILPRNVPHQYNSSPKDPWTIYWVHFEGVNADLLYQRYSELGTEPVFTAYDENQIMRFDRIFELLDNSFDNRNLEITNIKLHEFISNFIYAQEMNLVGVEQDKITKSIAFMKKNIGEQFSIKELAEQQNLSVTHYSRMFRVKTGTSPNLYQSELKIQKSCQYLYFTDRSIKEICVELGFRDPYYFSRLFKKLMGVSPVHYKNKHHK